MNAIKKINANGFSLIEVIAVLVIMGILAVG
jgi:prepilin-type N-terminal cleavage/methylation domain-containing protein